MLQCIENEKQNKIIQSQSAGVPVELDSPFIRYSTFKTGKEQLVSIIMIVIELTIKFASKTCKSGLAVHS